MVCNMVRYDTVRGGTPGRVLFLQLHNSPNSPLQGLQVSYSTLAATNNPRKHLKKAFFYPTITYKMLKVDATLALKLPVLPHLLSAQ